MTGGWLISLLGVALAGPSTCPDGQVAVGRGGHCCWPGQRWDRRRSQCTGMPRVCPAGWSVERPEPGTSGAPQCVDFTSSVGGRVPAAENQGSGPTTADGPLFETPGAFAPPPRTAAPIPPPPPPATVSVAPPIVRGSVDRAVMERAIAREGRAISACFDTIRREMPGAAGTVTLELAFLPAGTVSATRVVADELGSASTTACLDGVLSAITVDLPASCGVVHVTVPVHFDDTLAP